MSTRYIEIQVERDGVVVKVPVTPQELQNATHSRYKQKEIEQRIQWVVDDAKRRARNTEILKRAISQ